MRAIDPVDECRLELLDRLAIGEDRLEGGAFVEMRLEHRDPRGAELVDDELLVPCRDLRRRPGEENAERDLPAERLLLLANETDGARGLCRVDRARLHGDKDQVGAHDRARDHTRRGPLEVDQDDLTRAALLVDDLQDPALGQVADDSDLALRAAAGPMLDRLVRIAIEDRRRRALRGECCSKDQSGR